jgi:nucleoid-associated protein YgaU
LFFDVNAKLEEQKKGTNQVTLNFELSISTKPNVVKYNTTGSVTLAGKPDDIKKKLEVNPKTKIPQILFTIYQHVFNSIYMLSSNLNTPYPPPDLLHPMAEKIQILSSIPQNQSPPEKPEAPAAAPTASPAQPADKQAPNK